MLNEDDNRLRWRLYRKMGSAFVIMVIYTRQKSSLVENEPLNLVLYVATSSPFIRVATSSSSGLLLNLLFPISLVSSYFSPLLMGLGIWYFGRVTLMLEGGWLSGWVMLTRVELEEIAWTSD